MADSRQMFRAGQAKGQAEEKTEQWIDSAKDTAHAAGEKACEAAQSAADSAEHCQQQAPSFLQQTGEQIKNMAHGAAESVKQTLGMGEQTRK
ncbi:unnamed protein product [Victoria cruziana]